MERVDSATNKKIIDYINQNFIAKEERGNIGFAEKVGIKRTKVQDWLRGKADVTLGDLIKISKAYNKSIDVIVGLVPENEYSQDEKVRIASEYTGLSHRAVDLLHLHKSKKMGQLSFVSINYLFENVIFYAKVIPSLMIYLAQIRAIQETDPNSPQKTLGDYLEDYSEEEIVMLHKLTTQKHLTLSTPFETAKNSLRDVSDLFKGLLNYELYPQYRTADSPIATNYISRLQNSPDMEPEETEEDEQ